MAETVTKKRRWSHALLVVSLGLNLAVVGVVIGIAVNGGPPNSSQRYDLTAGPLTRAMDADRRGAVRDALRNSDVFRPADRSNIRADMRAILGALRAEEFDQSAFREALGRQRQRLQAGQDAVLDAVAAQIDDMSFEEREAFADRVEEQLRRAPPARERRGD